MSEIVSKKHSKFGLVTCEFCNKHIPRPQYREHSVKCRVSQPVFQFRGKLRAIGGGYFEIEEYDTEDPGLAAYRQIVKK